MVRRAFEHFAHTGHGAFENVHGVTDQHTANTGTQNTHDFKRRRFDNRMHIATVQDVTPEHGNHQNNDTNNRNHISLQKRPNGRLASQLRPSLFL
jgi:hypothetical protein